MSKGIVAETLGELQGERRIWVDMEFIEKWVDILHGNLHGEAVENIKQMLEEAGISIKK